MIFLGGGVSMPYILVVDDDIDSRGIIILALQDAGYKCMGAENGLEALLFMTDPGRKTKPYLILLDLNMPVMSGHKFLQVMKCCGNFCDIPIVIVSGEVAPAIEYPIFTKPMSLDHLLTLARDHWEKAGRPITSHPKP
jgi:CheY-like chemotaxis protein